MTRGMWLRRSTSRTRKRRKMADEQEASTSSTAPPKKRTSPSKSESPQHSPNTKRKRTQADRYQSDVVEAFSKPSKTRTPASSKKEVFFGKGAYLAVRSEGGFFLCQTLKYVYDNSRTLSIQWLEETKPGIYKMSFLDFVDRDSVLTQVQLRPAGEKGLKKLPDLEISRIDKIVNLSVKKEKGQLSEADGRASLDQLSEQIASSKSKGRRSTTDAGASTSAPATPKQTPNRRRKVPSKARTVATKILRDARDRSAGRKKTAARAKKKPVKKATRGKGGKKEEKVKKGRAKQDPNSKLVPNTKIELISKDPMFEVKSENSMPEVSKIVQCKRAIRAVLTNDMPLLKQLLANTKQVPSVFLQRSVSVNENALTYAIKANSQPFIKALLAEVKTKPTRCSMPVQKLSKESTGCYNYISLGHAVRNINVSRGGREGQDAFIKDSYSTYTDDQLIADKLAEFNASISTVELIERELPDVWDQLTQNIQKVVRNGHRKLAAELIKKVNENSGFGFNKLHEQVLTCDKPEELSPFKSVSVKKKPYQCDRIMPLHCAAINPNPKMLGKLLSVVPEMNVADTKGKKVIHYAAACTGSGPLELLLQRSAFADDTDNQGNTPLMIAASLNRLQNIEILVKKLKSEEKGGVFRRNAFGQTPLHFAAQNGQNDAVRALIKHGASLQAPLSAGKNKLVPFMVACERGHLQTVKILAESGAILDQRDKLKRTPLMLAVLNGHVPIAAFLLRKGCNPNAQDSSGNSPLHYAAGYGWWFVLRLLLSAGADPNALNDWKVPPLAIAFMKGHVGCADLLLEDPSVDVNFRDSDGWTMVMLTVGILNPEMHDQLKYLVEEKKASVSLKDANDWTALHHLAAADLDFQNEERRAAKAKISIDMATLLMDKGCDLHAKTLDGETALDIAIKKPRYNKDLVKFLLEKGIQLTNFTNDQDENLLHLMAKRSIDSDQTALFNIILDKMKKEPAKSGDLPNDTDASAPAAKKTFDLKELAKAKDKSGHTPFLRWAQVYTQKMSAKGLQPLEQCRAFLKCLLEDAESDVNGLLKDKDKTKTVVHMLCYQAEKPGKLDGAGALSEFPALEIILAHKPDLSLVDKSGRTPLLIAVRGKRVKLVQHLVKLGADITQKSLDKDEDKLATSLVLAMKLELFDLLDILLNPTTVHDADEPNQLTPIHYAAMAKHSTPNMSIAQALKKLVDKGANINARDWKGRTPLHYVCKMYILDKDPSTDALEVLLDNRADVFAADNLGRLPLHYLFLSMDREEDSTAIDPIEAVSMLKGAMMTKQKQIGHPDKQGVTVIHAAAFRGSIISLMDIAESFPTTDMKDSLGNTPLSMAALGGHISVVIFLLERGANILVNVTKPKTARDEEEEQARKKKEEEEEKNRAWTWKSMREVKRKTETNETCSLFRRVVKNDWQGILFLLMGRLEKFNVPIITPIKAAIEERRLQMALNLVSKSRGHSLSGVAAMQQNLLHILALESVGQQSRKVAEKLLSKGVGLGNDRFRCSPLTYAVLAENMPLCKLFWDHMKQQDGKQALTSTDEKGRNLLAAAFWSSPTFNEDLVSWLLEIGASLNVTFPVPLWVLEGRGAVRVCTLQLEEWYHRTDHPVGRLTPLLAAIRVGIFKQVRYILTKGADPNYPGKDSLTPLMCAVKQNDITLVKLLLNYEYDPEKDGIKPAKKESRAPKTLGMFGARSWQARNTRLVNGGDEDDDEDEEDEENDEDDEEEPMDEDEPDEDDEDMDENGDDEGEDMDESQENGDDEDDEGDGEEKPEAKKGKNNKKEETKPFEKTSKVNLSSTDSRGRTVIHHMMMTCDYGTYQNVELLTLFHKLGVVLDKKDNEGRTPLDYALEAGSYVMAEKLQELLGVKKPQMSLPIFKKTTWSGGRDWSSEPSINFREDSKALLEELQKEGQEDLTELPKYPKPKVDSGAELREAGEVLMDDDQDIPYDLLMTKVDVKYGVYGMNNFYKMQVVFAKGKDMYVLLTRWGRVGEVGQYQRTPFAKKEEAVVEFCKIFKAKSGNSWSSVKEFQRSPGKYDLVRTDPYFDRRTVKKVVFDLKSDKPSKLPSGTQDLIKTLTSPEMLKHALKQCGASERLLPFGHIQRSALDEASKILLEVQSLLKKLDGKSTSKEEQEIYSKISDLSSEFYMLVPNESFTYQQMKPLNDASSVETALQRISDMADLELTGNLMLGAQQRVNDVNPLDYIYRSLDCDIEPLAEDDVMAQLILKQIHQTKNGNVQVQRIYRVRRKGEEDGLVACALNNHKLLWHGTKPFNIFSILKRGLLVTPIGSPITGMRFGSGIYHADMFGKSHAYCRDFSSADCKSNYLFVNEVALGKMQGDNDTNVNIFDLKLKKECNSLKFPGCKGPDPAQDLLLPTGCVLPIGPVKNINPRLWGEAEYVVYKEAQVCLRYLVQIKA